MFGQDDAQDLSSSSESDDREALEAQMFGAEEPREDANEEQAPSREDAMFGEGVGPDAGASDRIAQALLETRDELAIGGFLFMQLGQSYSEGDTLDTIALSAPNLLDVYLDARPSERLRLYASGRILYDYTRPVDADDTAGAPSSLDDPDATSNLLLAPGVSTNARLQAQLAQLWLKFDIGQKVFFTVGRQRIRWGSGRFWNPTDFLNQSRINPIALFDQRLGADLVRAHIPIERLGWNLYAVAMVDVASRLGQVGGALRGEFLVAGGELALSMAVRKQEVEGPRAFEPFYEPSTIWPQEGAPLKLGVDYSRGLGPFEVRVETALTRGEQRPFYRGELVLELPDFSLPEDYSRQDEWIVQSVVSADLTLTYATDETLILAAEYFYNQAGYANDDLYLWLALQQSLTPLYLGRHYGALALLLPSPGSWNDSSFTASALGNLSDGSFLGRLDYSLRLLRDLSLNVYVMRFFGNPGEFNFRVDIPAIPGQTTAPTTFSAPRLATGVGLRMSF